MKVVCKNKYKHIDKGSIMEYRLFYNSIMEECEYILQHIDGSALISESNFNEYFERIGG